MARKRRVQLVWYCFVCVEKPGHYSMMFPVLRSVSVRNSTYLRLKFPFALKADARHECDNVVHNNFSL